MKRNPRLLAVLAVALLLVGFSYSFRLECDVAITGDVGAGIEALQNTVAKNGGEFVRPPSGENGWYSIDGVNLSFSRGTENNILIGCSIFAGSGCVHSTAEKRTREMLGKLVADASLKSGIGMRVLVIREAKK